MDSYHHERIIARGSFGSVDLYHRKDEKLVVIKKILLEDMTVEEEKKAYIEVEVMSQFDHPNTVLLYDYFFWERTLCIVMEYATGGTLDNYLRKRNTLLSETLVVYFLSQMVLGLNHVHSQSVLHRDLKPSNILVHPVGQEVVLKIADFGISKLLETKSKASTVVGTPCYMSPELCEGQPYNVSSDIWALGCILCELMTLQRTFGAETLGCTVRKILLCQYSRPDPTIYSRHLRNLLSEMLNADADMRPTTEMMMANVAIMEMCHKLCLYLGRITPCDDP